MFIEKEVSKTPYQNKRGGISHKCQTLYVFECDACKSIYKKSPRDVSKSSSGLTFCSMRCRHESFKKGQKLNQHLEKTCQEKYGEISAMKTAEVQQKTVKTLQERYGKEVTSALLAPGAKERRRETHVERYGAPETFQNERFVKQRERTWLKKYGTSYKPFPLDALEKAKKSMSKMPSKWSSKIEDKFAELLVDKFGNENVVRQKWVNGWPIDFWIKSIDTYIQFDGIYWHALDCDVENLRESARVRDKARLQKWENDRKQDVWFADNKMALLRITDTEFKKNPALCLALF